MHTLLSYFCHDCREQVHVRHNMACIACGGRSVEIYDPLKHMAFNDHIETVLAILEDLRDLGLSSRNPHGPRLRVPGSVRWSTIAADIRNYLLDEEIGDVALELLAREEHVHRPPSGTVRLRTRVSTKDGACSICLCDYKRGDRGFLFSCQHFFHRRCAAGWLKSHNTCPNCRRKLE